MRCDLCGLPDPYRGRGDGLGSCDCPRCEWCGGVWGSAVNSCKCDEADDDDYTDPDYDDEHLYALPASVSGRAADTERRSK